MKRISYNPTDPAPKFEIGNRVEQIDTGRTGKIVFIGDYDDYIEQYRYVVRVDDGPHRQNWNDNLKLIGGAMKRIVARTNEEVIRIFLEDSFPKDKMPVWGTSNLKITKVTDGWSLVNYATPMLYRDASGEVWFNTDKYSVTTSTIQNKIRNVAGEVGVGLTNTNEAGMPTESRLYKRIKLKAHITSIGEATVDLVAMYIADDYLYGASSHDKAVNVSFWPTDIMEEEWALVELNNVPIELAKQLEAMGTGEQTISDGYEAQGLAAPYVGPEIDSGEAMGYED